MQKIKLLYKTIKRSLGLSYKWMPGYTAVLFVISIATYFVPIVQAKVTGNIVNSIVDSISNHQGIKTIFLLIGIYVGVRLLSDFLSVINSYFDKRWWNIFSSNLEIFEMETMGKIEVGHFENSEVKTLISTVKFKGFWSILQLAESQFASFANFAVLVATSIIILRVNVYIIPILILSASFDFYLQLRYNNKIWYIWNEGGERVKKYSHLKDNLVQKTSSTQNRILKTTSFIIKSARGILNNFIREQQKADWDRIIRSFSAHALSSIGFGFSFYLIISKVFTGELDVGSMVFYLSILGQYVGSVDQVFQSISRQHKDALVANDIFKLSDLPPFVKESHNPKALNLNKAPTIEFRNVSFSYQGSDVPILKDFNLKINQGEKVALVGNNGAGKTTLIKLLCRFYDPTEGEILIDGVNLKEISLGEWYDYLSTLFQEYTGYSFTAKESIALGQTSEDIDLLKVKESATHSGAHDFISEWKDQYDQQLGSEFGGIAPSQGQEQKIAIARVLYRGGYVLVLDEPTASVDALSEADIFEKIRTSTKDRTLILISHRFNTVINMDRIIVIEHGKVVEEGNHTELMKKKKGVYAKMFNSQAAGYSVA